VCDEKETIGGEAEYAEVHLGVIRPHPGIMKNPGASSGVWTRPSNQGLFFPWPAPVPPPKVALFLLFGNVGYFNRTSF
jgi:hypothetical protein